MPSRVAIETTEDGAEGALTRALKHLQNVNDLNADARPVVVKVGVYNHKGPRATYPAVDVVSAIVSNFKKAPKIYLVESDNYKGPALERLQIWQTLFDERVVPFSLSDDVNTKDVVIADEKMKFSRILFEPNTFVSTHALRRYEKGTILKNLFGLVPDKKKARFHKNLDPVLLDAYDAIGGIDLSVIDATRTYAGPAAKNAIKTNLLIVGRDAVAVETIGAFLVGLKPENMSVIQNAVKRGFGEGDMKKIEVLGTPVDEAKERFAKL
ncbi:MAG: DUF362 domain-containing protein [Candidatus Bathyarchaeota archaeon]|nr:MAG: DUF362 domain-containing protein [Candidatus Bathyarchaeota archaeon]